MLVQAWVYVHTGLVFACECSFVRHLRVRKPVRLCERLTLRLPVRLYGIKGRRNAGGSLDVA